MRINSRIDVNQPNIVRALRQMGAHVQVLSMVGKGFPDLLICYQGKLALIEVKDGDKVKSKQKLTPDEEAWHEEWQDAPLHIVNSVEQVGDVLNGMVQP